jgi:hypothetical protein
LRRGQIILNDLRKQEADFTNPEFKKRFMIIPKANNSKVLRPYSDRMKYLLKTGKYNSGERKNGW